LVRFALKIASVVITFVAACAGEPQKEPHWGFCEENSDPFPERPPLDEPATLPWLRAEGTLLVDEKGQAVALRGFNFGSWLMMESWIPAIGLLDEGELLQEAEKKAQQLGLGELFAAAKNSNLLEWITEGRSHRVLVEE